MQTKAWRQGGQSVGLSASGGHQAKLSRIASYFSLQVCPQAIIQAEEAFNRARRKGSSPIGASVFRPTSVRLGWHLHDTDHRKPDDRFLWDRNISHEFDETRTRREFLVELISAIGIVR